MKKPHEQPTIGILLCATKNHEVVEYALSRTMSPALVAEYQTRLPDKKLLQAKLHEFYELAQEQARSPIIEDKKAAQQRNGRKKWFYLVARISLVHYGQFDSAKRQS